MRPFHGSAPRIYHPTPWTSSGNPLRRGLFGLRQDMAKEGIEFDTGKPGLEISGTFDSEIQCELHTVSLDENPSFIALSYCWGDVKSPNYMSVNGHKISVATSLELALRHMRHVDNDVILWADAICINQQDDDEKAVQVTMMGDIYAKASLVWVWLGESADDSDMAMDLISSVPNIDLKDPNYRLSPIAWSALKVLFQRKWWQRLWVIQEVLLSKRTILNCGHKAADLEHLVRLNDLQTSYLLIEPDPRFEPMKSSLSGPFDVTLSDWSRLRGLMAKGGTTLTTMFTITSQAQCTVDADKIFGVLSMCNAQCRQHVKIDYKCCARCLVLKVAKYNFRIAETYGPLTQVLQMHQVNKDPTLPSWAPDYTKHDFESHFVFPGSDKCTQFAAGANNAAWVSLGLSDLPDLQWHLERTFASALEKLREHKRSTLLALTTRFYQLHPHLSDLPDPESFLEPDFGPELEQLRELERSTQLQMEAGFRRAYPQSNLLNSVGLVLEDEGTHDTLVLPGLIVDTVSTAYEAPFVDFYTGPDLDEDARVRTDRRNKVRSAIKNWRHHVQIELSAAINPYKTPSGRDEAFWRTLIADRDSLWRGPPTAASFTGRFESFLNEDFKANEAYIRPYSNAAISRLLWRSFLVTEKGYFGLGRTPTRSGDVVCILRGGNVPFILRDRMDGFYEFIGEAYLHGIMDGSFVRAAKKADVREFRIR